MSERARRSAVSRRAVAFAPRRAVATAPAIPPSTNVSGADPHPDRDGLPCVDDLDVPAARDRVVERDVVPHGVVSERVEVRGRRHPGRGPVQRQATESSLSNVFSRSSGVRVKPTRAPRRAATVVGPGGSYRATTTAPPSPPPGRGRRCRGPAPPPAPRGRPRRRDRRRARPATAGVLRDPAARATACTTGGIARSAYCRASRSSPRSARAWASTTRTTAAPIPSASTAHATTLRSQVFTATPRRAGPPGCPSRGTGRRSPRHAR